MKIRTDPVCWSWPVPPLRDLDKEVAYVMALQADLPWDERLDADLIEGTFRTPDRIRFQEFHVGERGGYEVGDPRCAICGTRRGRGSRRGNMVDDHDHRTGMLRGVLCRACNIGEGRTKEPAFVTLYDNYRLRHPALILDLYLPYTSERSGWVNGWAPGEWPNGDPYNIDRPVTPWTVPGAPDKAGMTRRGCNPMQGSDSLTHDPDQPNPPSGTVWRAADLPLGSVVATADRVFIRVLPFGWNHGFCWSGSDPHDNDGMDGLIAEGAVVLRVGYGTEPATGPAASTITPTERNT